jgi:Fungal specific transcription factor domain
MEDPTTPSSSASIESDANSEDLPLSVSRMRQKPLKPSSIHGQVQREIGLMRNGTESTSASFVGSASGIHFVRTVYNAFAKKAGDSNFASPEKNLVPGEDDHLGEDADSSQINPSILWSKNEINLQEFRIPEDYTTYLSFEDLVNWTHSYFDTWHPLFPFLHGPSVMEAIERISIGRLEEVDDMSLMIVRSIISISLADSRPAENRVKLVPACLTFRTFDEALTGLQLVLVKPTSMLALQGAVSVQLFLVSMLRLNAASRVGALIVRMAFHLGLHRCPARFPSFSNAESQLRQRLFWSIYCLDRYLSQSLGLPLNIRDHDVDVCYPGEELHPLNSSLRRRKSSSDVPPSGMKHTSMTFS